jgi:hypothetical protein
LLLDLLSIVIFLSLREREVSVVFHTLFGDVGALSQLERSMDRFLRDLKVSEGSVIIASLSVSNAVSENLECRGHKLSAS